MALGWIGATMALAVVVKNPNSSCTPSTGALFGPRTPRQRVHNPAKANRGRSSLSANQVGVLRGVVWTYSQNDVAGTRQRFLAESQPRQCGLATLRMLVTGWPPIPKEHEPLGAPSTTPTIAQHRPRRWPSKSPHPRSRQEPGPQSARTRLLRNVPPLSPVTRPYG